MRLLNQGIFGILQGGGLSTFIHLLQLSLQGLENLLNRQSHVLAPDSFNKLTSSSILASAISCSLPLPFATFCASAIWARTASALKSSRA